MRPGGDDGNRISLTLENDECETPASIQPPAAPSNLQGVTGEGARVDLSWNDNSHDEKHFAIEYTEEGETNCRIFKGVAANTTSATLGANNRNWFYYWTKNRDLAPNTSYTFRVVAYKSYKEQSYSNEIHITTGTPVTVTCGSGVGLTGN